MNQNHERAEDHPVVDSLVDSEVETPAAVALEAVIPTVDSVEVALITINVTAVLEEENQASEVVETTMPVASVEDNLGVSDKKIAVSVVAVETPAASEVVATPVALEVVATPVAALEEETLVVASEEETLVVASEVVTLVVASEVVTPVVASAVVTPVVASAVVTPVVASAEEVAVVVTMAMACSLAASLTIVPKTLFVPFFKVLSQTQQEFRCRQAKIIPARSREWLLSTLDHLQKLMLL